jgi:hypothetical protein
LPNSVLIPVAVTTAFPRPQVTCVAMKTEFFLSATAAFPSTKAGSFSTCADSPVRAASRVFRSTASRSRASAAARSPSSRRRTYPGTR